MPQRQGRRSHSATVPAMRRCLHPRLLPFSVLILILAAFYVRALGHPGDSVQGPSRCAREVRHLSGYVAEEGVGAKGGVEAEEGTLGLGAAGAKPGSQQFKELLIRQASKLGTGAKDARISGWRSDKRGEGMGRQRRRVMEEFYPVHRSVSNKCWSRSERHLYHKHFLKKSSRAFVDKVEAYMDMHARCMKIKNFTQYVTTGEDTGNPHHLVGCQYVFMIPPGAGFGNRAQALVSNFLYALLTNRVLLVKQNGLGSVFCDGFAPKSSWKLPLDHERLTEKLIRESDDLLTFIRTNHTFPENKFRLHALIEPIWFLDVAANDVTCDRVQEIAKNATWITMTHGLNLIPAFFSMPIFHPEMERLFPDRVVFKHVSDYILHPENILWDKITKVYHGYLKHSQKLIGLQVRTLEENDTSANPRILQCMQNVSGELPAIIDSHTWSNMLNNGGEGREKDVEQAMQWSRQSRSTMVFVASVHPEHVEYLRHQYESGATADGTLVTFHHQLKEETLKSAYGFGRLDLALIDVWLLSFCDVIFNSALSSFGAVAAGIAGIKPYALNIVERSNYVHWRENQEIICWKHTSYEPCGMKLFLRRECSAGFNNSYEPPYVRDCLDHPVSAQVYTDDSVGVI